MGQKIKKKSRPKKLMKSNKSISWNFFWANSIIYNFKIGQKSIFELEKSLKLPKMQFHEKNFWFIWFHEFFCLDFFKFCGPLCPSRKGSKTFSSIHRGTYLTSRALWDVHNNAYTLYYMYGIWMWICDICNLNPACQSVNHADF